MRDNTYFELRELTEQIFTLREWVLKNENPSSKKYKESVDLYNELCKKRDLLEERVFGK